MCSGTGCVVVAVGHGRNHLVLSTSGTPACYCLRQPPVCLLTACELLTETAVVCPSDAGGLIACVIAQSPGKLMVESDVLCSCCIMHVLPVIPSSMHVDGCQLSWCVRVPLWAHHVLNGLDSSSPEVEGCANAWLVHNTMTVLYDGNSLTTHQRNADAFHA